MQPARKLSLKRESLAELATDEMAAVAGNAYSGNPFCVISITAPCVTSLCTDVDCLVRRVTTAIGSTHD